MREDAELLRLYADEKSEEAFAELVRRNIGSVYAVAIRRVGGDAHIAQEVVQEVFADLARKARALCGRETLAGWLFVSARFAASKAVRRDQQRRSLWRKAQQVISDAMGSNGEPDWDRIRPVLDDAIHELSDRDREAVLLRFFEKRTFGDLGEKLSLSENGARMRVERALEKLRRSLGRRGITSTSAALAAALGSQASAAVPGTLASTVTAAAIAEAARTGGTIFLYLMAITKAQLATMAAVVLAGATIMGVAQHREITTLRAQANASRTEATESRRRADELSGKLAAADAARAKIGAQIAEAQQAGGRGAAGGTTIIPADGVKVVHMKDIIREHPEYVALQRKETRRDTLRRYSDAIAALNLPTDQEAKLKDLLSERTMSSLDAQDIAEQAGVAPDSKGMQQAEAQAQKEVDQEITALVGESNFDKLEAMQGAMNYGSANKVDLYSIDMADAGAPLSSDQLQSLALLVHNLSSSDKNPDASAPGFRTPDPTTWLSPLDQQILTQATAILTPDQLQVLRISRSEDNQRSAILKQYTGAAGTVIIKN